MYGWPLVWVGTSSSTISTASVSILVKGNAFPFFHAFTGSDTSSQFLGKAKKSSWACWKSFCAVTETFLHAFDSPFQLLELASPTFTLLENFTCILYDKTTCVCGVNELQQELFHGKYSTNSGMLCSSNMLVVDIFSFL